MGKSTTSMAIFNSYFDITRGYDKMLIMGASVETNFLGFWDPDLAVPPSWCYWVLLKPSTPECQGTPEGFPKLCQGWIHRSWNDSLWWFGFGRRAAKLLDGGLGRAWTFSTRANSMVLETKDFGGSNRGAKNLKFNGHFLERAFGFFCWFASSRHPQEISTCPEKVTQSVWVKLHFHLLIRHYDDSKSKKRAT